MAYIVGFIGIYLIGEMLSLLLFYFIRKYWNSSERRRDYKAILGGCIERLVLFFGLIIGASQVLILFGALKVGTRVGKKKDDEISSEYFLIGNLTPVFLALSYYAIVIRIN
jgi:hypothetical protein